MEENKKKNGNEEMLFQIGKSLGMSSKKIAIDDWKKRLADIAAVSQKEREEWLIKFSAALLKAGDDLTALRKKVNEGKAEQIKELVALFAELEKIFTPGVKADQVLLDAANEFRNNIIEQYRKNNTKLFSIESEINVAAERLNTLIDETLTIISDGKTTLIQNIEQIEREYKILEKGFMYGQALNEALSNEEKLAKIKI